MQVRLVIRCELPKQSVAILVEDSNVTVRLERVRSDHHDSSINVVQILDGRLGIPRGMGMRDAHDAQVHWKHVNRKCGEPNTMRGERRHHDLIDKYLVLLLLSAQEQNSLSGIHVKGVTQYAIDYGLLKLDSRQPDTPTNHSL